MQIRCMTSCPLPFKQSGAGAEQPIPRMLAEQQPEYISFRQKREGLGGAARRYGR